ncbi:MAG: hypothetical protein M0Z54_14960 [Thermaerobacter sp.]|nr:hypothetical protein [Thermaerobacter sp.]
MAMASKLKHARQWAPPEPVPAPRQRIRSRRLKPWVSLGLVLGAAFVMALAAALSGTMMARVGFQVDQMQSQLTSAQRARQVLQDQVVTLTGAARLAAEAHRLGVPLSPLVLTRPAAAEPAAARPPVRPGPSIWHRLGAVVSSWLERIRGVQGGHPPASRRSVHRART